MKQLGRWRRPAVGILSLAFAACTMDAGNKQGGDGGDNSVDETGGDASGGESGLSYLSGGNSSLPAGGSPIVLASGGMRHTGGVSNGAKTCSCACVCGTCSTSTNSGPTTKYCGAGDSSCVDCYVPCREFCNSIACTMVVTAEGACK